MENTCDVWRGYYHKMEQRKIGNTDSPYKLSISLSFFIWKPYHWFDLINEYLPEMSFERFFLTHNKVFNALPWAHCFFGRIIFNFNIFTWNAITHGNNLPNLYRFNEALFILIAICLLISSKILQVHLYAHVLFSRISNKCGSTSFGELCTPTDKYG